MKILVINSGSSSIKFQLLDMSSEQVLASGLVERIGEPMGTVKCTMRPGTEKQSALKRDLPVADHQTGMLLAVELLTDKAQGVVGSRADIGAIGHRVVHGGERFHQPTVIDSAVLAAIRDTVPLAPLHNPANLDGIEVALRLFPGVLQVAVFDTAFHQSIPPRAYLYALPYDWYEHHRIRRYGFHGTSHKYVAGECARLMGKPLARCNLITVHLGNGCSMTAIENGRSIDTTLGMTPLEGLVMGTRSGDIDPAIHVFLHRNLGLDIEEIDRLLNKESGLKGICGYNDMRDIHSAVAAGDRRAALALDVQTYRNRKYIGAFMAVLGRVDGLVFTAGIGENDDQVRSRSVQGLECFGIAIDPERNQRRLNEPRLISTDTSAVQVWVIPTNEELAIARETVALVNPQEPMKET
ncbi:acetate/propionate family kinase [Desulfofustis limnaeus]|jgi:acetate kinase|uniref:Acetate kinase n=1 Tax=Desulfofustis limnaeus TaxID=2740163 RepID=A0ABM7W930_9BACT|nr:acetate kinase [Desulfofustis limnaeus]MDX9893986.1 acetate kinase [Desulfofustis sp.]BDD87492.1 acetate kinase [Desulfofustis limnaeus]